MIFATSISSLDERNGQDLAFCQKIAGQVRKASDLPSICRNYKSIVDTVNSKDTNVSMDIAFEGMPSGSAIQARRSRTSGLEHHAKINRRLTSSGSNYHYQPQAAR